MTAAEAAKHVLGLKVPKDVDRMEWRLMEAYKLGYFAGAEDTSAIVEAEQLHAKWWND